MNPLNLGLKNHENITDRYSNCSMIMSDLVLCAFIEIVHHMTGEPSYNLFTQWLSFLYDFVIETSTEMVITRFHYR